MEYLPKESEKENRQRDEVSGVVYDRNDGIEREWMQRAKVLTHWFLQHLS